MIKFLKKFTNIGVNESLSDLEAKKVRVLNQLTFAVCSITLIGLIVNLAMGGQIEEIGRSTISSVLFGVIFILHYKAMYILARVYLIILSAFSTLTTAYFFGAKSQIEYAFILLPPIAFVLFPDKKKYHLGILFIVLVCFLLCKLMYQYLEPPLLISKNLQWLVGVTLILVSYALFDLFKYETELVLQKGQLLLGTVKVQKEEIEDKNTNLILAYKQLEQKQEQLELIMNTSPSCISYVNTDYRYQFNNDTYCQWFGLTKEELKNKHVKEIIGEKTFLEHTRDRLNKTFGGEKQEYENVVNLNYIGKKYVRGTLIPDFDIYGIVRGCFIFVEDITPLKEIELVLRNEVEERKMTEKMLTRSNEELQNYAYVTSHNLRSPLANIIGLVKLYDYENPINEFNRTIIENVEKATETMDEVIKDLNRVLAINKEAGGRKERVNLEELLAKTLQTIEQQFKASNADIQSDFSDVPEILAVKSYMDSIFLNLLTNAIKYSSDKRPPLIQLKTEKLDNGKVCFSIRDNGIGIDLEKYKGKLFGLYKRIHPNIAVEGKGLGLHLVKKQVESMGGTIGVESKVDEGTVFRIHL